MLRPEVMNRIRETSKTGLYNWLKANNIELSHPWYNDYPQLKVHIQEESDFIRNILAVK